jgi:hypothetical protein
MPVAHQPRDKTYLVSCHLIPDNADHSGQLANQLAADVVLDRLEDACPQLFQPRRPLSEPIGDGWQRIYMNTDLIAWVSHGGVKFNNPMAPSTPAYLGRERDWAKGPPRLACGRRNGHYFATSAGPTQGP